MLRITIFAVGKLKEQFWKDAVAEYLKRLGGYAKIEVRELPDSNAEKEASALLSALPRTRAHYLDGYPRQRNFQRRPGTKN